MNRVPPPDRSRPLLPRLRGPVVVFGATGLVGGHLTRLLLDEHEVEVRAPGRRAPDASHPRLHFVAVDFDELVSALEPRGTGDTPGSRLGPRSSPPWLADATTVFICLGTTRRKAGSKEAFRRVDFTYVAAAAHAARIAGVDHLVVVSSVGASTGAASFYLQVKGEAEDALLGLGFPSLTVARPSLLLGDRSERRPLEAVGGVILSALSPLLRGPLSPMRPIEAETVARAMIAAMADPPSGVQVLEPHHLRQMGTSRR